MTDAASIFRLAHVNVTQHPFAEGADAHFAAHHWRLLPALQLDTGSAPSLCTSAVQLRGQAHLFMSGPARTARDKRACAGLLIMMRTQTAQVKRPAAAQACHCPQRMVNTKVTPPRTVLHNPSGHKDRCPAGHMCRLACSWLLSSTPTHTTHMQEWPVGILQVHGVSTAGIRECLHNPAMSARQSSTHTHTPAWPASTRGCLCP